MKRRKLVIAEFIVLFILVFVSIVQNTYAEQSSSSPESGTTSYIKTIYTSLVSLSHGSNSSGSWGDWGSYWNRIRSAGEWVPTGDASESDVASGKTFYKDSRTQKVGTASPAVDWSLQALNIYDDLQGPYQGTSEEYQGDESTWTNTQGTSSTGIWKDGRTGLYWSSSLTSTTNSFSVASCDYFTTEPRGSYDGSDSDCGNAINYCATLSRDATGDGVAETNWYMPSQKELMMAYIDGIYNKTNTYSTGFANGTIRSSTELSDNSNYEWDVELTYGRTTYSSKSANGGVRCVRRD